MTIRIPPEAPGESSQVYTIDFRETAPALSNETMYKGSPELSRYGGLSVGVPGELRGLEEAHRRWGSLPWESLVQPSVELAKGWKVDAELAKRITVRASSQCPIAPINDDFHLLVVSGLDAQESRLECYLRPRGSVFEGGRDHPAN